MSKLSNKFTEHSNMIIKDYPSKLPYRIFEALSSTDSSSKNHLLARISVNGWAWFVIGRKLFIWKYLDDQHHYIGGHSQVNKPKTTKCYELLLPASDIAYKSDLICVTIHYDSTTTASSATNKSFPSAIAVSPEGLIRYWPNIFHQQNSFDQQISNDLNGQECQMLLDIAPLGYVLGTTTNSLAYISIDHRNRSQNHSPMNQSPIIQCQTLKIPQGLFSGLGRRFTSFIYGTTTADTSAASAAIDDNSLIERQTLRMIRLTSEPLNDYDQILPVPILVLNNCTLQKWLFEDRNSQLFCGRLDLEKFLKETFITKYYNRQTTDHNQIMITIQDVNLDTDDLEVVLLVMCSNSDLPNDNHLAIVQLQSDIFPPTADQSSSSDVANQQPIKTVIYLSQIYSNTLRFNLIPMHRYCYLYNSTKSLKVNIVDHHNNSLQNSPVKKRIEEMDLKQSNDHLFGMIRLCSTKLLLLTSKNGFVTIESNEYNELIDSPPLVNLQSSFAKSPDQSVTITEVMNENDKLKLINQALYLFMSPQQQPEGRQRAEKLIWDLFPFVKQPQQQQPMTNEMDSIICKFSAAICDQIPTADPRWSTFLNDENCFADYSSMKTLENSNSNLEGSVLIATQLESKILKHNSFIDLLKCTNIWSNLKSLTTVKSILPTKLMLCEHIEKLLASISLWKLHSHYGDIILSAIRKVLDNRLKQQKSSSNLTYQDLFYREVTKIDELFWQFLHMETADNSIKSIDEQSIIIAITDIMIVVFGEICRYRQSNGHMYETSILVDCDYVPWSSTDHPQGVREVWMKQYELLLRCFRIDSNIQSINTTAMDEMNEQWSLIGQKLYDLADIILDSFVCQLKYLKPESEKSKTLQRSFEVHRYKCIEPLLLIRQYARTAELAEKYEDFQILIRLCEMLNNQEQLKHYSQRFHDKGFSEYLFEWYLREGKQGKMLLSSTINSLKLDEFLTDYDQLKWLHQLQSQRFKDASSTLKKLAFIEQSCLQRRKTMLSIGKLALIVDNIDNNKDSIALINENCADFDNQLRLIKYQMELSDELLRKNGYKNHQSMPVLSPEQLIDLLLTNIDGRPNEELKNYQIALEIVDLLLEQRYSIELYRRLLVKIWLKAAEKDSWNECSPDNIEYCIKKSFFYQLAINYCDDQQESKRLPSIDLLIENFENSSGENGEKFQYFLRAAYEYIKG